MDSIALDVIRTDGGTQMRGELNRDVYLDYRDKFLAGVKFPPIDLFHDGSAYWLADGFHRFYGAREAKQKTIDAVVRNGTVRDATLFAIGANQVHGLKRTNADKRACVLAMLNDETWVTWSDGKIAEHVGVSQKFVTNVRDELRTVLSSSAAKTTDDPKLGRDGKKYRPKMKPAKPTKPAPPATKPEPPTLKVGSILVDEWTDEPLPTSREVTMADIWEPLIVLSRSRCSVLTQVIERWPRLSESKRNQILKLSL